MVIKILANNFLQQTTLYLLMFISDSLSRNALTCSLAWKTQYARRQRATVLDLKKVNNLLLVNSFFFHLTFWTNKKFKKELIIDNDTCMTHKENKLNLKKKS